MRSCGLREARRKEEGRERREEEKARNQEGASAIKEREAAKTLVSSGRARRALFHLGLLTSLAEVMRRPGAQLRPQKAPRVDLEMLSFIFFPVAQ